MLEKVGSTLPICIETNVCCRHTARTYEQFIVFISWSSSGTCIGIKTLLSNPICFRDKHLQRPPGTASATATDRPTRCVTLIASSATAVGRRGAIDWLVYDVRRCTLGQPTEITRCSYRLRSVETYKAWKHYELYTDDRAKRWSRLSQSCDHPIFFNRLWK